MSGIEIKRNAEIRRYYEAYKRDSYYMKPSRQDALAKYLASVNGVKTMLDVSCGRGESLAVADRACVSAVGCEVVEYLCNDKVKKYEGAHSLPYGDASYDLVTSLDVMEHLFEEDIPIAIQEMWRVAGKFMLLGICCRASPYHMTVKPPEWWSYAIVDALGEATYAMAKMPLVLPEQNYVYFEVAK